MEKDSLISKINTDKMNSICFDCGEEHPTFVSINNGIFLCNQCATVHMSFPQGISSIENNNLNALSENELKYLAQGGNTHLNDFILDEFPKLENYSQKLLYKTRGMDYYRKRLDYYVNGGAEPKKPSQIVGCQLLPDNYYRQQANMRKPQQKYEPKTRTYKPDSIKSKIYNTKKNNENDFDNEEEFFRDPFLNDNKFGKDEEKMLKKFFGNDDIFKFDEDNNSGFGRNKVNQPQPSKYEKKPLYQEAPKTVYSSAREPKDNFSKRSRPEDVNIPNVRKRPLTSSNPIFVPSRKHKYIKREEQNNNNNNNYNNNNKYISNNNNYNSNINNNNTNIYNDQNNPRGGTINPMKYVGKNYRTEGESSKYNPFKRRDSTELITIPNVDNNNDKDKDNNLLNNKRRQKPQEIPLEFHKQASGLGQIADAINEKDEDSFSENEIKENDSSDELRKIPEHNTHKDDFNDDQITFKNSIRNKYKKRKSEQMFGKMKNENENQRNQRPNNVNINNNNSSNNNTNNNTNNNVYESKYNKGSKYRRSEPINYSKKTSNHSDKKDNDENININIDGTDTPVNRKWVRRLSKMKISSTHWNINQLGDIRTYPDAIEVEE